MKYDFVHIFHALSAIFAVKNTLVNPSIFPFFELKNILENCYTQEREKSGQNLLLYSTEYSTPPKMKYDFVQIFHALSAIFGVKNTLVNRSIFHF